MKEIYFIDKPKGMTSHDVVAAVKKKLKARYPEEKIKVGHAGTLDPLASGLLIVGVNKGTKRLDEFLKLPKRYTAEIRIGESRTTGDMEGEIVEQKKVENLDKATARAAVLSVIGENELEVPKYSAVKVDGEPLYKKARRGEEFEPPVRTMKVHQAKLLFFRREHGEHIVTARLVVASGVYVRAIAEEIGRKLGYPAVTQNLRRTKIGRIQVNDAQKIEDI